MLPFSLYNKEKTCNLAHEQTPFSDDIIDSVLRHWEVGSVKDLSATSRRRTETCISLLKLQYLQTLSQ
jgi:hypothetical protein